MSDKKAYADPDDPGNGPEYHTGKPCIVRGCSEPAGTWWGKYWCFKHNVARIERIDRISSQLDAIVNGKGRL